MKLLLILTMIAFVSIGCGGNSSSESQGGPAEGGAYDQWHSTPEGVIKGLMYAYETRDDSLYASLFAEGFRYEFKPPGADSADVLTWGRKEEVSSAGSLFKTPELESVSLFLQYGKLTPVSDSRVMVPISGGELRLDVKEKDPTLVSLNRQEIYLIPHPRNKGHWQIIAWYDFPSPE